MLFSREFLKKALTLLCLALLPACGSSDTNGGGGGGTSSTAVADATAANSQAIATATQGVIQALSAPPAMKLAAISPFTINCVPSGTAGVSGDVTDDTDQTSFELVVDYNACGAVGLEQSLTVAGDATVDGGSFNFSYLFDGVIDSANCDLTYSSLEITVNSSGTSTINGSLEATCDSGSVTCNYENVSVTDQTALQNACS